MNLLRYSHSPFESRRALFRKIAIRCLLIFAVATTIPFKLHFYRYFFGLPLSGRWFDFNWIDATAHQDSWFFYVGNEDTPHRLILTLISCTLLAGIWQLLDSKRKNFDTLFNIAFTLIRYQLIVRLVFYGFMKVFPLQMPFPSLSMLNTALGDITAERLYWLSVGVSPYFEIFSGVCEVLACLLLLYRRTLWLGAMLSFGMLFPIWVINVTYNSRVQVLSFHLLALSVILLVPNILRFYQLLIQGKAVALVPPPTVPLSALWQKKLRLVCKWGIFTLFFVFKPLLLARFYAKGLFYRLPNTQGVTSLTGYYEVLEFKKNGVSSSRTSSDTLVWKNMVFEKFSTLSIATGTPHKDNLLFIHRVSDYYGTTGRLYYEYALNGSKDSLRLTDSRSPKLMSYAFKYNFSKGILSLEGRNSANDSLSIRLVKIDRSYTLTPNGR